MAHRIVVRLAPAALLAIMAAACGSASTSTSSTATRAAAASASVSPAPKPTAAPIPAGFARYQAKGFSFLAPGGLKPAPDGGLSGLPAGASAVMLTAGGKPVEKTSTQIIVVTNPRLRTDVGLDQVALSLETADASDPSAKHVHTDISTMTVAGAQQVRTVTESYVGPNGPHARTLFHRTWLMVLPKPGLLMDLVVVNEPQRGGRLNPAAVLDTFRLGA